MRCGSQPVVVGFAEKPWPGSDGITTSNASDAVPPDAVGLVSGSMIFNCSMIEPGQPWVMITGNAFGCLRADVDEVNVHARRCSVRNCGKAFSLDSTLRQSCSVCQ